MSENINKKGVFLESVKGGMLATIISLLLVLVFTLLMRVFSIDSSFVSVANVAIKVLSVFFAVVFGIKSNDKLFWKAVLVAICFVFISNLLFLLLGGQLIFVDVIKDLAICTIIAFIACLIALNRKKF